MIIVNTIPIVCKINVCAGLGSLCFTDGVPDLTEWYYWLESYLPTSQMGLHVLGLLCRALPVLDYVVVGRGELVLLGGTHPEVEQAMQRGTNTTTSMQSLNDVVYTISALAMDT